MTRLLVVLVAACVLIALVSGVEAKPKLIAKTVFESKWVKNAESGELEERKIPKKQLFEVVMKSASVPDPTDPANTISVLVPTEVPYKPNRRAHRKLDKLKKRLKALRRREHQLKFQYAKARSSLVDLPVLEDGAPAPPDAQEVKMAEELYAEIDATQTPKAKTIKQDDLDKARAYVVEAGARREAHWNFFEDIKDKMLVPSHGWSL